MGISPRYNWTGHNFPSEGWGKGNGSSVTWFRWINDKRFMFTAWIAADHKTVTTVQAMDTSSTNARNWTTRHVWSTR